MSDAEVKLSAAGRSRKEGMREALLDELGRVQHRRRARRRAGGAVVALALVVGVTWLAWRPTAGPHAPQAHDSSPLGFEFVRTDTSVTASWIVRTDASALVQATRPMGSSIQIERMSDQELITRLAALGTPSGLARSGDRAWLTEDIFARR